MDGGKVLRGIFTDEKLKGFRVAFSVMPLKIDEESSESKEGDKKQHIDNLTLCH